jgi:hypothetical protein
MEMTAMESAADSREASRKTPAVRAIVAGALRPLRTIVIDILIQVPLHIAGITMVLLIVGSLLTRALPADSILGTAGTWAINLSAIGVGFFAGALAGVARVAARAIDRLETAARDGINGFEAGDRVLPVIPLAEARSRYEGILDRLVEAMFERMPAPRPIISLARRGLRQAPIDDFLDDCESKGLTEIGFTEVRNWSLVTGIPYALMPLRAKVKMLRIAGWGTAFLAVVTGIVLGLVAGGPAA